MAYLAKDDYTLRIALDHLDEILDTAANTSGLSAANIISNAESWAQAMIKSYLVTQYNIAAEYGLSSPTPRNFQIMQVTIDLVLCTLHKTINPRDIPENVQNSCDSAMQWLIDARNGVIVVDIPQATPTNGVAPYPRTFLESQPKFISKPYQDLSLTDLINPLNP